MEPNHPALQINPSHPRAELSEAGERLMTKVSGVRFFNRYPEAGAVALQLRREGFTFEEIAKHVAPLVGREDKGNKMLDLEKMIFRWCIFNHVADPKARAGRAAAVVDSALEKLAEVIPDATTRDIGSLSMAAHQMAQVEREAEGVSLPPVRHVHVHVTPDDLERMAKEAEGGIIDV